MADLGRMIATKQISPVEVVRAHLDRISALDGTLRAFITVCADAALEAARAAESELMAGRPVGPLHGVPWAPKDLYSTKGVRTTGGSKILADSVPAADATVVARLTRAGAIVLGKLNMHEFAYGPEGINAHYGDTRNPWSAEAHRCRREDQRLRAVRRVCQSGGVCRDGGRSVPSRPEASRNLRRRQRCGPGTQRRSNRDHAEPPSAHGGRSRRPDYQPHCAG